MDSNVQDWQPRILHKSVKNPVHHLHASRPPSNIKTIYNEDGNEIVKLKTVSHEMAQFIIKSRVEKGLKQIDLAKRANIDAKTIGEIERGGCIYVAVDINKIARTLGITIPRQ